MPYAPNLKEAAYGRQLDDRNDVKWSHPELVDWWVAGNAEMIDMFCDENVPLEKRKKRLEKITKSSIEMFASKFDIYTGWDKKADGNDYGHVEKFAIKGCPEAPDEDNTVYVLIPNDFKERENIPVIFYIMGGALFNHTPEICPEILRWSKKFNCAMVIPMYRTPLDGQYPDQINDIHAGYEWLMAHGAEYNFDTDNVTIAGESTGAHLALCTAFRLKRYGYAPRGCVVNDPMVDDRNFFESSKIIKDPCDSTRAHNMFATYVGWQNCGTNYLGPEAFANHATVDECKGLCPIFMNVGESDQDRDATMDFARKLYEARVPCSVHVWMGAAHATFWYARKTGMAERFWANFYGDLHDCMTYDMRRPWAWDEPAAAEEN